MSQTPTIDAADHAGAMHPAMMAFRQLDGGGDWLNDLDARADMAARC
jgi:hypothetical protein